MDSRHLIYFSDPMCSWCWGFSPTIEAVRAAFGARAPVRLIMGGLRPGTTEPMTAEAKTQVRGHWAHVHEASGQAFDKGGLEREGFVYDTDPAARAVVLARRRDPDLGFAVLRAAQEAFYARNRDVTDLEVLADLAADHGLDRAVFRAGLEAEDVKAETWRDYATSQRAGVTGFPTLIAGPRADGAYEVVTRGFQGPEPVLSAIEAWLARP